MNPMGCQKGASWSHCHYSPDRVTHPLNRVGKRGEGKFERVSWDEALTDIADAMLDAIEEQGPESILTLLIWVQGSLGQPGQSRCLDEADVQRVHHRGGGASTR